MNKKEVTPKKKARMKTSSCKAKARRLQDEVAAMLLKLTEAYGLEAGDIRPVSMGVSGVDIILSPAAKRLINLDIECKNVESLAVMNEFIEHYRKYRKSDTLKVLIHNRNMSRKKVEQDLEKEMFPLVTMRFIDLLALFEPLIKMENTRKMGFNARKKV
jgi:hypothetical protein